MLRPKIETILGVPLVTHRFTDPSSLGGLHVRSSLLGAVGCRVDSVLLSAAADVVRRLAGDKELGHFLVQFEADENLNLR